jgi:glycosyltransferase involved in cell wall biosynthesis
MRTYWSSSVWTTQLSRRSASTLHTTLPSTTIAPSHHPDGIARSLDKAGRKIQAVVKQNLDSAAAVPNDDITVAIPCFNYGRYVHEAVESALGQEGGPPRVVVVDDGSTEPDTHRALERLPEGVRLVRRPNGGLNAARNTGAESSDTPFLLILDADDKLAPNALRLLRRPLEEDPELGYSYGYMEFFGEWTGRIDFPDWDPYRLLHRMIVGYTCLQRRELWEDIGGWDEGIEVHDDWDFFLTALERGWRGRRVPEVTTLYRRHTGSMHDRDRANYRHGYRELRAKHRDLYRRRGELAAESELGPVSRLFYRTFWAWRPVPARVENAIYSRVFR